MATVAFNTSTIYDTGKAVSYSENSVVSKVIAKSENVNITLFAFDTGQSLTRHISPFDAMIQVIEGTVKIEIGENSFNLSSGKMIIMPANVPHAVEAISRFKMMLTMIKG